ncbi:LolA family protein [Patiriisocius marinus]|uniref:Membrane protein n=1 Tax=Patiriisocius marinus TaxID=1397112 RepID=A0A5J4IYZ6_9FLAO|nr:outer-membrane lipoprotein carrier protein LolA [Patiriisocius marinus]GER60196.1 membrane protein [Patiriisocius marinus]
MKVTIKMVQKLMIIAVVLFTTVAATAQDANSLLKEVSAKVRSYDNIAIDFKYNLNNKKEGVNQDTRGDVALQGENYVLNMLGTTRIFDGAKIYTIVPEDEEVTISKFNAKDDKDITPSKMLTFYESGYNAKLDIVQNVNGRKIQYVKLSPIDTNAEIKDILLGIDKQTNHIYKVIQTDSKGTKYTITVQSFKTNQPISKTLFTFDEAKYTNDGYYINKLD